MLAGVAEQPSDKQHEPDEIMGDDNTVLGPVPRRMGSRNTLIRDADARGNVIHNETEAIGYGAHARKGDVAIGSGANAGAGSPAPKRRSPWAGVTRFLGLQTVRVVSGVIVVLIGAFILRLHPFGTDTATKPSIKGNNNVLVGRPAAGVDGSDNTIVNSTGSNGSVILSHGGTAIGAGAHASGHSVAIGTGAGASSGR
jgi:hypothetical protein